MQTLGQSSLTAFLGREATKSLELKQYIRTSLRKWQARMPAEPPVIMFRVPTLQVAFPVEVLPLLATKRMPAAKQVRDLPTICQRFTGFGAITHRVVGSLPDAARDSWLHNVPKLPVKILHHAAELAGSAVEVDFFQAAANAVDVDGPWPDSVRDAVSAKELAVTAMFDPRASFYGPRRPFPDQILHLACHCETESESVELSSLRFAGRNGDEVALTLQELGAGFLNLQEEGRRRATTKLPLVFLNACGSSMVTAATATSFPHHFLQFKNRGVLGTEAAIPDSVAAEFARFFYDSIFQQYTVGHSVLRARSLLLRARGNPLGILYSYYGNPHLRLQRAV
ncbi:MAG: hypothetical protein QOF58_5337 [Pseudonocardiales bacterium]|nr:hypothetical protein [Pseudonocardiales bacterium]